MDVQKILEGISVRLEEQIRAHYDLAHCFRRTIYARRVRRRAMRILLAVLSALLLYLVVDYGMY